MPVCCLSNVNDVQWVNNYATPEKRKVDNVKQIDTSLKTPIYVKLRKIFRDKSEPF